MNQTTRRLATGLAAGFVMLVSAYNCSAAFIGLGQAGNYVLFDVSNSQWQMNNAVVTGNMAAGPGTTYNWSGSGGPYGPNMYYQTGGVVPPVGTLGGSPTPTAIATDLTQAVLDARAAAASAAGLVANLAIPGNQITATGSVMGLGAGSENVIDLTQVNMSNGNFTINGTASETFIFRVSGQFNVGNSTIRVAGGVTPNHVLWYFPNTTTIKSPNGSWDGTILALNSPVQLDNTPTGLGPVHGAIIASDDVNNNQNWVFSIVSGFKIVQQDFTNVPEPATFVLGIAGLAAVFQWRRRRSQ